MAVVTRQPGRHSGGDEQGVAEPPLERGPTLHPFDDRGVEPDAGVEAEEPAVDLAEPDRTEVGGVDAAGEQLDRFDRVVRHADRAGEHVGRPAGQHTERGPAPGDASGDFVERAVAPETDDHVEAATGRVVGEAGGVAAPVGLDEFDVVPAAQPSMDDHGVARGHRRGERIDHEQDSQGSGRYRASGVVTGHASHRSAFGGLGAVWGAR